MLFEPYSQITSRARALGYDLVGFTSLTLSDEDRRNLARFLEQGYHGEMHWFSRYKELRQQPDKIMPGAKGAVVLGVYYRDQQAESLLRRSSIRIARYALGRDYHRILRKRGAKLLKSLQADLPGLQGRVVTDSAPVPEKILGRMAGIGWQGKNSNLIHPQLGSYFFLSLLFLNIALRSQGHISDHCGSCNLCIAACPTGALKPYRIDARRCISYLTIEHKSKVPSEYEGRFAGWAFGCDICQEVCPYNRNRQARHRDTKEEAFRLRAALRKFLSKRPPFHLNGQEHWQNLSYGSPLRRISYEKWKENIRLALLTKDRAPQDRAPQDRTSQDRTP